MTEKKTLVWWWWWKEEKKTQFPTFEIEIVPGIVYSEAEAALASQIREQMSGTEIS